MFIVIYNMEAFISLLNLFVFFFNFYIDGTELVLIRVLVGV